MIWYDMIYDNKISKASCHKQNKYPTIRNKSFKTFNMEAPN